jgi:CheY-like chemotaxis protein
VRVLAVDDDTSILELLKLAIEMLGDYQVTIAKSGPEALAKIGQARVPFDCFLLDIQMPQISGVEVCENIRAHAGYADTPIIMLTAMSEKRYIDSAFAAGATDYLSKPFDLVDLRARIHLAQKSLGEQPQSGTLKAIVKGLIEENPYKIDDPIPMQDVDHTLSPEVFGNYLNELHRIQYLRTRIFAIQVLNTDSIFSYSTGLEFRDHMTDITEVISGQLCGAEGLTCYRGSGVFCCVIDGQYEEILEELPRELDIGISSLGMVFRDGSHVGVRFEIGAPITPGLFSKMSVTNLIGNATQNLRTPSNTGPLSIHASG